MGNRVDDVSRSWSESAGVFEGRVVVRGCENVYRKIKDRSYGACRRREPPRVTDTHGRKHAYTHQLRNTANTIVIKNSRLIDRLIILTIIITIKRVIR